MLKALTLYAIVVQSVRTILIDQHGQVVAYSPISNPTEEDLQALAHDTFPQYPAGDFVVKWDRAREQYRVEYIPY